MRTASLFILACLTASAAAAKPFQIPEPGDSPRAPYVVEADVPELSHWTSVASLVRLQKNSVPGSLPFSKKINGGAFVVRTYPDLLDRPAYFTWSNPIGGVGLSEGEMYASKTDPALLRFSMKKNLRILVLESADGMAPVQGLSLRGVDVIFHSWKDRFKEFIIVNGAAVTGFTADPGVLRPEIEKSIKMFEGADWGDLEKSARLSVGPDLFNHFGNLSPLFESLVLPRVRKFLKSGKKIPTLFKGRNELTGAGACGRVMLGP